LITGDGVPGPDVGRFLMEEGAILFIPFDNDLGSWALDMQYFSNFGKSEPLI
jgi:hypothetical protein